MATEAFYMEKEFCDYLHVETERVSDTKLYLLFLYDILKHRQPSEVSNTEVRSKLQSLLPFNEITKYLSESIGTEDLHNRLKKVLSIATQVNISKKISEYNDIRDQAYEEETRKIYLINYLTDNLNNNKYDDETITHLSQLYDRIFSGEIKYPEDMENYGLMP